MDDRYQIDIYHIDPNVMFVIFAWLVVLTVAQIMEHIAMTKSRDELDAALTDVETKEAAEITADQALRNAVTALLGKLPASADYQAEVDRLAALGIKVDTEAAADTQSATDANAAANPAPAPAPAPTPAPDQPLDTPAS